MGRFEGSVAPLLRSVRKLRGAAIPHNKYTRDLMTTVMPLPTRVVLPMQQHVGSQCEPLVKRRAHVDVGTRVGHSQARTTADIFSPVSGTVMEVRDAFYANGRADKVVVIEPDGGQTVDASVRRPQVTDYASLVEALKHSGIVGLGGAGFPTALKMDADFANIDLWLVNAAECEPFISSDFREMLEHPHDILLGIQTCLDLSGVPRALICIEDDKPEAIELLRRLCADRPQIDVHVLPSRYPQGASRVLVRTVTGRAVPRGGHLTDVGVMLFNVTTMSAIGGFLQTGMPLIRRRITVTGDAVARPQNLEVCIGAPIREVLAHCGIAREPTKVIIGGPMMGKAQVNLDAPIVRQESGLLAFGDHTLTSARTTACIRCGTCINSCPMMLSPMEIQRAYRCRDVAALEALMVDLCVECGTCSYVCPSHQPLTPSVGLARRMLKAERRREGRG